MAWAAELAVVADLHDIAELDSEWGGPEQFCKNELSGTMRVTLNGARGVLDDATRMRDVLEMTLWECSQRRVWVAQARVLLQDTRHCSVQVAREVERILLANGSMKTDPSTLRRRVRKTVLAVEALLEPTKARERERDAIQERHVWHYPGEDGMGVVHLEHTAEQVLRHKACLAELVRLEAEADLERGITRTDGQRAADIVVGLPAENLALKRALRELLAALHEAGPGEPSCADGPAEPEPATPSDAAGPAEPHVPDVPAESFAATSLMDDLHALLRRMNDGDVTSPVVRGCRHASATEVVVLMPFATLLGFSRDPAVLQGHGPISAAQALALVPDARLRMVAVDRFGTPVHVQDTTLRAGPTLETVRRAATDWYAQYGPGEDPVNEAVNAAGHWTDQTRNGEPLTPPPPPAPQSSRSTPRPLFAIDNPEPQYVPSAHLTRLVLLRDPVCTGIGCNRPARLCDKDHELAYRLGGATAAFNLRPKSRHCHRAKTISWTCERSRSGKLTWTSPLGRTYHKPGFWDPPPDWDEHLQPPDLTPYPN